MDDSGFYKFLDENYKNLDRVHEKLFINILYQAYLVGYKNATIDSVQSLKARIDEFNDYEKYQM